MVVEIDRLCSLGTVNNVTENTRQQSKSEGYVFDR